MSYTYPATPAWDPTTQTTVKAATFYAYATTDTGFTVPLALTDLNGVALPSLASGPTGVLPAFTTSAVDVVVRNTTGANIWTLTALEGRVGATGAASTIPGPQGIPGDVSAWKPSTNYAANQPVVNPTGDVVKAIAAFTSGTTYNPANWTLSATYIPATDKGAASGVATLDAGTLVPVAQIPNLAATYGPTSLTGAYASRPAFGTVKTGTLYYATDTLEAYRATGTAGSAATGWAVVGSGGTELAYTESLSTFSLTTPSNSVGTDVPSLAITFTPGERPVKLEFGALLNIKATPGEAVIRIVTGTSTSVKEGHFISTASTMYTEANMQIRKSLTPGTPVTYKIQALGGTTSVSYDIMGAATWPMWIRASTL